MSETKARSIGLIVGAEKAWSDAFAERVAAIAPHLTVELVSLGGSSYEDVNHFDLIFDRKSHEIPYYRGYLKVAVLKGIRVINNPFITAVDDKFLGIALATQLGIATPRTVLLPNKRVDVATTPGDFRNLSYPMNWQGIIDNVGVPAILKDALTGGRRVASRVSNVDDLINRYDESDTLNVILQELVDADVHVHCFTVGGEYVRAVPYSLTEKRYLGAERLPEPAIVERLAQAARRICRAYGYELNMVEFVVTDDRPLLINPTNPAPEINRTILPDEDFQWCVEQTAALAVHYADNPSAPTLPFRIPDTD